MHTKNFEMRERFKHRKNELKSRIGDLDTQMQQLSEEKHTIEGNLAALKRIEEELRGSLQAAQEAIAAQTQELALKAQELAKLEQQRQAEIQQLVCKLRAQVSLETTGLEGLTAHDAPGYSHLQLVSITQQRAAECVGKCSLPLSDLGEFAQKLLVGLEGRFELFSKYEESKALKLAATKVASTQTSEACGKLRSAVASSIASAHSFVIKLRELRKGPDDLAKLRTALLTSVQQTLAQLQNFHSYYGVFQKAESKLLQNSQELKQTNSELATATATFVGKLEELVSVVSAGFYLGKRQPWQRALSLSQYLLRCMKAIALLWTRRLSMDLRLQYPGSLKSVKLHNDGIVTQINNVCSQFEDVLSCVELMVGIPEACWYFLMSPFYSRGRRYLETIKQAAAPEGVPYQTALTHVETLRDLESALEEQRLEVASLEKQLADKHKESEKTKATVRKLQNDVLVLASASQDAHLTDSEPLVKEPDMISEDVRNGIQRIAARLIDFGGEALPIEKLTVEQDLIRQLRARAVETIRQLSGALIVAEKKIAVLERDRRSEKRPETVEGSHGTEVVAELRAEISSQKSQKSA